MGLKHIFGKITPLIPGAAIVIKRSKIKRFKIKQPKLSIHAWDQRNIKISTCSRLVIAVAYGKQTQATSFAKKGILRMVRNGKRIFVVTATASRHEGFEWLVNLTTQRRLATRASRATPFHS